MSIHVCGLTRAGVIGFLGSPCQHANAKLKWWGQAPRFRPGPLGREIEIPACAFFAHWCDWLLRSDMT